MELSLIDSVIDNAKKGGLGKVEMTRIIPKKYWSSGWNLLYHFFGCLPVFAMDNESRALWSALKSKGYCHKVTYVSDWSGYQETPMISVCF